MEQELIDYIIENGISEVLTQEQVHGGSRPLTIKYTLDNYILNETIVYAFPATDDAFMQVSNRIYDFELTNNYNTIEL